MSHLRNFLRAFACTLLVSAITPGDLAALATELGVEWLPKPCTYTEIAHSLLATAS